MASVVVEATEVGDEVRASVEEESAVGVGLGDAVIVGDFEEDGDVFVAAVFVDAVVADAEAVDDDAEGQSESADGFDGKGEVVEAEGGGFGDEEDDIGGADGGDHGAGGAGGAVDDVEFVAAEVALDGVDEGRRLGLADLEGAGEDFDVVDGADGDGADGGGFSVEGFLRADSDAAAATVAEFGVDQGGVFEGDDGVELTEGAAVAAGVAEFFVDDRYVGGGGLLGEVRRG